MAATETTAAIGENKLGINKELASVKIEIATLEAKVAAMEAKVAASKSEFDVARRIAAEASGKPANASDKQWAEEDLQIYRDVWKNAQATLHAAETTLASQYALLSRLTDQISVEPATRTRKLQDESLSSFFRSFRDAKEQDHDGLAVMILPKGSWDLDRLQLTQPVHREPGIRFLLRDEYKSILDKLHLASNRGAIVTGTSGIGKSAFRFYLARLWLRGDISHEKFKQVIFNLGNTFYELDESAVVTRLPAGDITTYEKESLALFDPCHEIAALQKNLHFQFMLLTTSVSTLAGQETKFGNYSALSTALHSHIIIMETWTSQEVTTAFPGVSAEIMMKFGCIPRLCCLNLTDDEMTERHLFSTVNQCKLKALLSFFQTSVGNELQKDDALPYALMKIEASKSSFWGARSFVSKYIAGLCLKQVEPLMRAESAKYAAMMKNPFAMQGFGHIFEKWAFAELAKGTAFEMSDGKVLEGAFSKVGSFEHLDLKSHENAATKLELGKIYAAPPGYGSIDAFGCVEPVHKCQLLMFQETVSRQHTAAQWKDVKHIVEAFRKEAEECKVEAECLLVYLVPSESWDSFEVPRCISLECQNVAVVKGRLRADMDNPLTALKTWEEALHSKCHQVPQLCQHGIAR